MKQDIQMGWGDCNVPQMNIKQHTLYIYTFEVLIMSSHCALFFCNGLMVPGEWYELCISRHLTSNVSIVVGSGW